MEEETIHFSSDEEPPVFAPEIDPNLADHPSIVPTVVAIAPAVANTGPATATRAARARAGIVVPGFGPRQQSPLQLPPPLPPVIPLPPPPTPPPQAPPSPPQVPTPQQLLSPLIQPLQQRHKMRFSNVYPNKELTRIDKTPTHATITVLEQELLANANSVDSQINGGRFGHQGLVLNAAMYAALDAANPPVFVMPAAMDFPTAGEYAAAGVAGPMLLRLYDHTMEVRAVTKRVQAELLAQTIAAINPIFLAGLAATKTNGIGDCTIIEIIQELRDNYGTVTSSDILQNLNRLDASFDPSKDIAVYWANIKEIMQYATAAGAQHTIPDSKAVLRILNMFEKNGHFPTVCYEWRLKAETDWVVSDFITAINKVHRLKSVTAAGVGYGANLAAIAPATIAAAATVTPPPVTPIRNNNSTKVHSTDSSVRVVYCSIHGVQNHRAHGAHTNADCPDKGTNNSWKSGATLLDRMGGSNIFHAGSQNRNNNTRPHKKAAAIAAATAAAVAAASEDSD